MTDCKMKTEQNGYGLTRAEIRFRLPDCRSVVSRYIWEEYDLAPDYPRLFDFLANWQERIEGALQSVQVSHRVPDGPVKWQNEGGRILLH